MQGDIVEPRRAEREGSTCEVRGRRSDRHDEPTAGDHAIVGMMGHYVPKARFGLGGALYVEAEDHFRGR